MYVTTEEGYNSSLCYPPLCFLLESRTLLALARIPVYLSFRKHFAFLLTALVFLRATARRVPRYDCAFNSDLLLIVSPMNIAHPFEKQQKWVKHEHGVLAKPFPIGIHPSFFSRHRNPSSLSKLQSKMLTDGVACRFFKRVGSCMYMCGAVLWLEIESPRLGQPRGTSLSSAECRL